MLLSEIVCIGHDEQEQLVFSSDDLFIFHNEYPVQDSPVSSAK